MYQLIVIVNLLKKLNKYFIYKPPDIKLNDKNKFSLYFFG